MKRTHLLTVLAGLVAVATISQDAFARGQMYHPGLGRFMQRDPVGTPLEPPMTRNLSASQFTQRDPAEQYADGPNLYGYVSNNPVNYIDPLGLWKITRDGKSLADAEAEKDDTMETLAKRVGLGADEWQKWATVGVTIKTTTGRKNISDLIKTDKICPGEKLQVPNTVLAYWGGELGGFGKGWVMWGTDVDTLKKRGFNVSEQEGLAAAKFERYIQDTTKSKELHGVFFWGHGIYSKGAKGKKIYVGIGTDSNQKAGEY